MNKVDELRSQFLVKGHCGMVKDGQSLSELLELIKTPRGVEHCTKHNLPTLDIIRGLKDTDEVKASEWIIDTQGAELVNPEWTILAGNTEATIICDTNMHICHIVLLHGAKATIKASGYSVVVIDKAGDCEVTITKKDNAKVSL